MDGENSNSKTLPQTHHTKRLLFHTEVPAGKAPSFTTNYGSKPKILLDNFWSGDLEETAARLRNRVGLFSRRAGMRRRSRFRRPLALKLQMLIETSPLKTAHPGGCNEMTCHVNEVPRRGVNYFTPAAAPTLESQIDSGHFLLRVPQTT